MFELTTKPEVGRRAEFCPLGQNLELLIAEIPSNKEKQYTIQITGHMRTKLKMEQVIAEVVDIFVKMEV